eukprot:TRINITY_DN16449_c0_g1_i1.p1 TRINITY_DN16449_c0_g1~~TRINITY_DN16449_c0_g1_i1.p1  ORF type:complete len:213 (-),score=33.60 TRINITY_DN16449_c0_g1_i1:86-724(-)
MLGGSRSTFDLYDPMLRVPGLQEPIKAVVVGDAGVGKTCLLITLVRGLFPHDIGYPRIFDNQITLFQPPLGEQVRLWLWNTNAQDESSRPQRYAQTDVFIVCYSVSSPDSFFNVRKRWIPEICQYAEGTPFVLVGLKTDLRESEEGQIIKSPELQFVTHEEGLEMGKEIGAGDTLECAACDEIGIWELFISVSRIGMKTTPIKSGYSTCCLI